MSTITRGLRWPTARKNHLLRSLGGLLLILFLLLALALQIPAFLLTDLVERQARGKLTFVAVSGSLWKGQAQPTAGGVALAEQIRWQWLPDDLAQGRWGYQLKLGERGAAHLQLGMQGISLDEMTVRLAVEPLLALEPRSKPFGIGGTLQLQSPHLQLPWSADDAPEGRFTLEWLDFSSSQTLLLNPLGTYKLEAQAQGAGLWRWNLQTTRGIVQVNGNGSWSIAAGIIADLSIQAEKGKEVALTPLFLRFGVPDASIEQKFHFNLK